MSKKNKNANVSRNTNVNSDWRAALNSFKEDIMTPEEKAEREKERELAPIRIQEFNKRRKLLYEFLAGYKQNSGIFVNNFFRDRDYKTYCEDKFHGFEFDVTGLFPPNLFDDISFSFAMVHYLRQLEEKRLAYYPITSDYIQRLINFSEVLDVLKPLENDIIVYRGCSTLERNGVNGIVSTTVDERIAEQFSRGTILKIHVPKGTKYIDICSIRPKEQRRKDKEKEFLLPPCEYQILSDEVLDYITGLNNDTGQTRYIEMTVTPLDLLTEFLKMLENPPREYDVIRNAQHGEYEKAVQMLKTYLENRNRNNTDLTRRLSKFN